MVTLKFFHKYGKNMNPTKIEITILPFPIHNGRGTWDVMVGDVLIGKYYRLHGMFLKSEKPPLLECETFGRMVWCKEGIEKLLDVEISLPEEVSEFYLGPEWIAGILNDLAVKFGSNKFFEV